MFNDEISTLEHKMTLLKSALELEKSKINQLKLSGKGNSSKSDGARYSDKLSKTSKYISEIGIPTIAIFFTIIFALTQFSIEDRQIELASEQLRLSQLQALQTFIPYLDHSNNAMREFAASQIAEIAGPGYARQLARVYPSAEVSMVAENAYANGFGAGQRLIPDRITATATIADYKRGELNRSGWIYLGNYVNGSWQTSFLDFSRNLDVQEIVSATWRIRSATGTLNVRDGLPEDLGQFPNTVDILKNNSTVYVEKINYLPTSKYTWGKVSYRIKK